MPLNQPVYVVCAVRSECPTGEVRIEIRLEGKAEPLLSQTGPIGRKAIGRWERIVARVDQFATDLGKKKLVGIRVSQRCASGAEIFGGRMILLNRA